jgi:hypothetical protein
VPGRLDRAGIGELAHLDIGAAVAQHLDALPAGARMARAVGFCGFRVFAPN